MPIFARLSHPFSRLALACAGFLPLHALANGLTNPTEDWMQARPTLEKYCYDCHGGKKTKGSTDLKKLDGDPAMGKEFALWSKVHDALNSGDMPPDESKQPTDAEKAQLMKWLGGSLEATIRANANDPGIVTIRRLTNAEYDHTIRDLTGTDYGLAREFLPDGGGGEGFTNVGDVLFVSPQQLEKYFAAARKLTENATILPGTGITFQPTRVGLRSQEQVRGLAEQALYVWYQKMAEPLLPKDGEDQREADYMTACWKYKYRAQTGAASLEQLAKEASLTQPFLENWWAMLNGEMPKSRFLDLTRVTWRELPGPDAATPQQVPAAVTAKIQEIQAQRRSWLGPVKHIGNGVQRMQQDADGLKPWAFHAELKGKKVVHIVLGDDGDGGKGDLVQFFGLTLEHGKTKERYVDWLRRRLDGDKKALEAAGKTPEGTPKPDTAPIKARITEAETALAKFGKHPLNLPLDSQDSLVAQAPTIIDLPLPEDAIRIRGEGKIDFNAPDSDFATAQWMATGDTPPDPTKIIPGYMTLWKRQTPAAGQTMHDFEVMRITFPDEYLRRLEEVARNFQRGGKGPGVYYLSDTQLTALIPPNETERWKQMMTDWRLISPRKLAAKQETEWDQALQQDIREFATKAWRRPLVPEEVAELEQIYNDARKRELDRETSAREVLVRVLVSPNFIFKLEAADQPGIQHLTPWELATRLSYFLWSSMPDAELNQAAADGSLNQPEVVAREVKRMLRDPRAAALAQEFTGQWLEFDGFEQKSNVDAKKFPEFTPELRHDMQREAAEFFTYLLREDRPVREIVTADYTFLNDRLATYYGVPGVQGGDFRKVAVAQYQRGGVLGMGAILTKNSYPHRTSPVLRGNWLLHSILGTPTPPPPNDVPKLDENGGKPATLRARLEMHRANKACSVCHDKIDPLGFSLEGFDAIGRVRTKDDSGLDIDNSAQIKNGPQFKGLDGLRNYLATRDADFTELFCRKLIGYALGRSFLVTDRPLVETMRAELNKSDDHFSAAIVQLALSRQFQNRRNE